MPNAVIRLQIPPGFDFRRTVYSHGWSSLPPFSVDSQQGSLRRVFRLQNGKHVVARIQAGMNGLTVHLSYRHQLSASHKRDIRAQIRSCLRLDDDLNSFYAVAKRFGHYRWIPGSGAGRLLRSPTVFEDIVKTICTTNCTWGLTTLMVSNLCKALGDPDGHGQYDFPTPQQLAQATETFLRNGVKTGYRSPYILEFARRVSSGVLDPESWRDSPLDSDTLYQNLRSIKGVGDYAAGNMLKLLGRYDRLGLDSWVRSKYYELHHRGRRVSDQTIEKKYEHLGEWRGLFFWLEMTKHWHNQKFPT